MGPVAQADDARVGTLGARGRTKVGWGGGGGGARWERGEGLGGGDVGSFGKDCGLDGARGGRRRSGMG